MTSGSPVLEKVHELIQSGKLRPGKKIPSERALAAQFGVGRQAVQAALKELELAGVIERRQNCRPTVSMLGSKRNPGSPVVADQIGVWILPDVQDLGGNMVLQGIRQVCGSAHYRVLIGCPPSYSPEAIERAELDFLHSLSTNPRIAGAIIWDSGNLACVPVYQSLLDNGFPLVFVDREPPCEITADVVSSNNRHAARSAVKFLLDLGHRRIAMVVGKERSSSVTERIEGYFNTLRGAEIEPDPSLIFEMSLLPEKDVRAASEALLQKIAHDGNVPTAIFAVNDRIALHLLESAKKLGIAIPDRLSLVGFDWLMRWLPSGGELTSVAQRFDEMGGAAAQRVLDRIAHPGAQSSRQILLDTFLVQKHSAGVPFDAPIASDTTQLLGEIYEQAH
jgi:DNA-binding LacI/PurR family transcriptional regulator